MAARTSRISALVVACMAAIPAALHAQTMVIEPRPVPPPVPQPDIRRPIPPQRGVPLELRKHTIDVSIIDGTAETTVEQVFFNPHPRVVEGMYIFPLADDAAVGRFTMFVNGEEIEGKLLDVEEARKEYESIVRRMRDPALLEYLGTRMFRARIFPINPKSEVRIRLSYSQMLRIDDGLVRYRYPLNVERHSSSPIGELNVLVKMESRTPIKSVFSPSHHVAVSRPSEHKAVASLEEKNVFAEKNFELYYTLSEKEFGLSVLTFRQKDRDGYFLVRIAPPTRSDADDVLPKDVVFVIDVSGSMSGEKIVQARKALRFCIENLHPKDRFNIIRFAHEVVPFRDGLVEAGRENVQAAFRFADEIQAGGGTNIHDALLAAVAGVEHRETDRPFQIVFMTDGQPTVGVRDEKEILKNFAKRNAGRVRLYVFGVGYDVNTRLLDLLAEQNRGTRDYAEPGEDLELKLSSFYRKVAEPVLAALSLEFQGLKTYDVFPAKPGDLFAGGEVVVVGRYQGEGTHAVQLSGTRRGKQERFVDEVIFPVENQAHEFVPRLWATRKIGFLLDEIRLHGENKELKDAIVDLATEYGIVTPYTAYLVTEPEQVASRPQTGRAMRDALHSDDEFRQEQSRLQAQVPEGLSLQGAPGGGVVRAPAVGETAVRASQAQRKLRESDVMLLDVDAPVERREKADAKIRSRGALVQRVGSRTFYQVGSRWEEADYDPKVETKKIELFSEAYFALLRKHPELAQCFAQGERVVVVVNGTVYETVPGLDTGS